jgi:DNA-binding NarL/FixJ family response regulator
MTGWVRVLIFHEHRLLREGLRALLQGRCDLHVVAVAADLGRAELLIGETDPDVLVIDLREVERTLQVAPPLVALGEQRDQARIARALRAGVAALVTTSDSPDEVAAAIRAAAAGRTYLTPLLRAPQLPPAPGADLREEPLRALTCREKEIFALVVAGHSTAGIARQLDLSPRTVETHRAHLLRKVGARSAADLVRFAAHHDLLPS